MNNEIFLNSTILVFLVLALFICIGLLIIIFIYLRPFTSNVPILLTFNIYSALFLTCISMLIIYVYNLYGHFNPLISVKSFILILFNDVLFSFNDHKHHVIFLIYNW
jgi:hypothetical protein